MTKTYAVDIIGVSRSADDGVKFLMETAARRLPFIVPITDRMTAGHQSCPFSVWPDKVTASRTSVPPTIAKETPSAPRCCPGTSSCPLASKPTQSPSLISLFGDPLRFRATAGAFLWRVSLASDQLMAHWQS